MNIWQLSALELREKFMNEEISAEEIVRTFIRRIKKDHEHEKPLNALTYLMESEALKQAQEHDAASKTGQEKQKPLWGVPILIKDNINITGQVTTCASRMLENYRALFDATVIEKLVDAGAVLIGKTNMDEFAMGSSSEHSAFGLVRNFRDRNRVPGGSSGGSASAVAACFAPLALGSDTGGSIRQPASFCGIVGMKPTYSRVSRYGIVAYSSSLDQIGPMANTVSDCALLLEVISGYDPKDSTSSKEKVPSYLSHVKDDIKGKRIGIPKEYFPKEFDPQIKKHINRAIDVLKSKGCEIVDVSLPHTEYGIPVYYVIATAEGSSNLARVDGIRYGYASSKRDNVYNLMCSSRSEGFGFEPKRRICIGTYVLSSGYYEAYYLKAQKVRTQIKKDFMDAFKKVDVILGPTAPTTAFKLGEKVEDPLKMYLNDIYTVNVNLAGLPGISIPFGEDDDHLPVGIQLVGDHFQETLLLNVAWHLEQASSS